MSLMIRDNHLMQVSYDLLVIAEHYQSKEKEYNKSIELYLRLFQGGDPRVSKETFLIGFIFLS